MPRTAAQRVAIRRVRHNGTDIIERESLVVASICQNRPDRARRLHGGVGPPQNRNVRRNLRVVLLRHSRLVTLLRSTQLGTVPRPNQLVALLRPNRRAQDRLAHNRLAALLRRNKLVALLRRNLWGRQRSTKSTRLLGANSPTGSWPTPRPHKREADTEANLTVADITVWTTSPPIVYLHNTGTPSTNRGRPND